MQHQQVLVLYSTVVLVAVPDTYHMKMYYNRCKKKLKRQKRLDRPNNISSGNKNLISNAKLRNKKEHKKDKQQTEKIKTAQV